MVDGWGHIFLFKKLLKICVFCLVSRKIRENALFMTSQLALWISNEVIMLRFLILSYYCANQCYIFISHDILKNRFQTGQNMIETVPSSLTAVGIFWIKQTTTVNGFYNVLEIQKSLIDFLITRQVRVMTS